MLKKSKQLGFILLAFFIIVSCSSTSKSKPQPDNIIGTNTVDTSSSGIATSASIESDIDDYIFKAKEAIDNNHISAGIKLYISALVRASNSGLTEKKNAILNSLDLIGANLTLVPHESWLKTDGSQIVGNSQSATRSDGIMPSVYLYTNYGYAKGSVPDAYIRFEFISNDGKITSSVTTDSKGLANTHITSIVKPNQSATIRAYPVFTSEGHSFAYKTIYRDFVYIPYSNTILVTALETNPVLGIFTMQSISRVVSTLKKLDLEVMAFNSSLDTNIFYQAFDGKANALEAMSPTIKVGYFAFALINIEKPKQVEYAGKLYNIYKTNAKVIFRIINRDGRIIFSSVSADVIGQGSNASSAVDDCMAKANKELESIILNGNLKTLFNF